MDKKEIYKELKENPKNVRFEEFRGGKGSHRIFVREGKTLSSQAIHKDVTMKKKP